MPPSWTSHSENIAQAAPASSSSSTRRIPSIDLKGKAAQPKLPPSIVAAIADAKKKEEALQKAKEEHERALVLPKGNFKLFGDTRRIDGDGVDGVPSDPRLKSSTSLDFGEKHRQKSKVPVARLGKLVGFQWDQWSIGEPPKPPPSGVLVIRLSPFISADVVRRHFSAFGRIDALDYQLDKRTGQAMGIVWVKFAEDAVFDSTQNKHVLKANVNPATALQQLGYECAARAVAKSHKQRIGPPNSLISTAEKDLPHCILDRDGQKFKIAVQRALEAKYGKQTAHADASQDLRTPKAKPSLGESATSQEPARSDPPARPPSPILPQPGSRQRKSRWDQPAKPIRETKETSASVGQRNTSSQNLGSPMPLHTNNTASAAQSQTGDESDDSDADDRSRSGLDRSRDRIYTYSIAQRTTPDGSHRRSSSGLLHSSPHSFRSLLTPALTSATKPNAAADGTAASTGASPEVNDARRNAMKQLVINGFPYVSIPARLFVCLSTSHSFGVIESNLRSHFIAFRPKHIFKDTERWYITFSDRDAARKAQIALDNQMFMHSVPLRLDHHPAALPEVFQSKKNPASPPKIEATGGQPTTPKLGESPSAAVISPKAQLPREEVLQRARNRILKELSDALNNDLRQKIAPEQISATFKLRLGAQMTAETPQPAAKGPTARSEKLAADGATDSNVYKLPPIAKIQRRQEPQKSTNLQQPRRERRSPPIHKNARRSQSRDEAPSRSPSRVGDSARRKDDTSRKTSIAMDLDSANEEEHLKPVLHEPAAVRKKASRTIASDSESSDADHSDDESHKLSVLKTKAVKAQQSKPKRKAKAPSTTNVNKARDIQWSSSESASEGEPEVIEPHEEAAHLKENLATGLDTDTLPHLDPVISTAQHSQDEDIGEDVDPIACGLAEDDEDLYYLRLALERADLGLPLRQPEPNSEEEAEREGPHRTGSARTEGYYKVPDSQKAAYLPSRNKAIVDTTNVPSSVAVSRNARAETRRVVGGSTADSDVLNFNQLKGRKKQLKFARSPIHDWGLYAMELIPQGSMVIEYVGELIRQQIADRREREYERMGIGSSYLFRIDDDWVVDATKKGNMSRLINHCCDPNCTAKIITINGQKKIVIYARQTIEPGDEITYDYKFAVEAAEFKIPCLCGATNCRRYLN